jgi:hypothetical protein
VVSGTSDAKWVQRHLGALVGLGGGGVPTGGDHRSEVFAAWRHFFEALAERGPLVLVFEDLHWADDGLLDFVDYMADWAGEVPLLVLGSARPELLARRPSWGGGKPNAVTLSLAPLSEDDTARLIGLLLGRPVLEAGQQAVLLVQAGGDPLYAEQYVQMLAEQGTGKRLPLPESIQGIVGARLDLLAPPEKRLLQDAAMIGKIFWPGAVAALGGPAAHGELEEYLHGLERKQFIRRERRSLLAGKTQYAFVHVLLRDVAYGQIPRAARADKHVRAVGWIESFGPAGGSSRDARPSLPERAGAGPGRGPGCGGPGTRGPACAARCRRSCSRAERVRDGRRLLPGGARAVAGGRAETGGRPLFRLALARGGSSEDQDGAALEQARSALLAVGDRARAAEADARLGRTVVAQRPAGPFYRPSGTGPGTRPRRTALSGKGTRPERAGALPDACG